MKKKNARLRDVIFKSHSPAAVVSRDPIAAGNSATEALLWDSTRRSAGLFVVAMHSFIAQLSIEDVAPEPLYSSCQFRLNGAGGQRTRRTHIPS